MIACELTSVNCAVPIGRTARGEHPMDRAATVAAASQWGAEPVMSDMEALMWRSEASPRLRSGGVIVDLLDSTPEWDRLPPPPPAGGARGRPAPPPPQP